MLSPRLVSRGFTLMEVMITVAIIGILAAVALPSYREYIRRSNIPEGLSALSDSRVKLENYYNDNRSYGESKCADGSTANWTKFEAPAGSKFSYSCALSGGQKYKVTVTGNTGTAVAGHTYTIDQDNVKKTTSFKGSTVDKSCWLVRGDEC